MNPTIEELIQIAKLDPLPAEHTSSYRQLYGKETVVERKDDELVLMGIAFGSMRAPRLVGPDCGLDDEFKRLAALEQQIGSDIGEFCLDSLAGE